MQRVVVHSLELELPAFFFFEPHHVDVALVRDRDVAEDCERIDHVSLVLDALLVGGGCVRVAELQIFFELVDDVSFELEDRKQFAVRLDVGACVSEGSLAQVSSILAVHLESELLRYLFAHFGDVKNRVVFEE